jgi:hypothetical protein
LSLSFFFLFFSICFSERSEPNMQAAYPRTWRCF